MWSELLRESGILVPVQFPVHVRINGEYAGVQTFLEQPDEYFCERHNRGASLIFGEERPMYTREAFLSRENWQQYGHWEEGGDGFEQLADLYRVVLDKEASDYPERIREVLDVDHYLKYLAHATINCQRNPSSHNLRWMLDPGVGRFQVLPWYQVSRVYILEEFHRLWRRRGWSFQPLMTAINDVADGLFRREEFRRIHLRHLADLLQSTHHRDEVGRLIDEWAARVRPDALADSRMHFGNNMQRYVSNEEWEATVGRLREMALSRIDYLTDALQGGPVAAEFIGAESLLSAEAELTKLGPGEALIGAVSLSSSNHVAAIARSITLEFVGGEAFDVDRLRMVDAAGGLSIKPVRVGQAEGGRGTVVEFQPDWRMVAGYESRLHPLDLATAIVEHPETVDAREADLAEAGPTVRQGRLFVPQTTRHLLFLIGRGGDFAGADVRLTELGIVNSLTGVEQGDVWTPKQSGQVWKRVRQLPVPAARTLEAARESAHPDGVSLAEPVAAGD